MGLDRGSAQLQPIEVWGAQVVPPALRQATETLQSVYLRTYPTQGELVLTGACEFECRHCIYPPDYGRFNVGMPPTAWEPIFRDLATGLGMRTFVYGGRSVTRDGVEALARLRAMLPDARIGMIDNGISFVPHRDRLTGLDLDWIDISLDGEEADHDRQRARPGSFRAALAGALWLKEQLIAPRVNVLTCLTVLNVGTVTAMMRRLNDQGFKNFFVTPVSVADPRPLRPLVVDAASFAAFIESLANATADLHDAHLEVELYDSRYVRFLFEHAPGLLQRGRTDRDHLQWLIVNGATPLYVNYYPLSLSGTRELIVNTNGDVIAPKAMAAGRVPMSAVFGNLVRERAVDVIRRVPDTAMFASFFEAELRTERRLLGPVRDALEASVQSPARLADSRGATEFDERITRILK
jgi:hypothetical protein